MLNHLTKIQNICKGNSSATSPHTVPTRSANATSSGMVFVAPPQTTHCHLIQKHEQHCIAYNTASEHIRDHDKGRHIIAMDSGDVSSP